MLKRTSAVLVALPRAWCPGGMWRRLAAATTDVTTTNFGGSDRTSIEEWCAYLQELTGFEPVYRDEPKAFGSLCIDTTRMHELIGETSVDWKTGVRGLVQNMAPELLKEASQ